MPFILDATKKQTTKASSSASSSSKSSGSSAKSSGAKSNSIKGFDFYKDDKQMSAKEAFSYLKGSSLFGDKNALCTYDGRMINAAQKLLTNDSWKVNMDADGDGTKEDVNLADAIADSFDSELDLYIADELEKTVKKYGSCSKNYLSPEALAELKAKGIEVSCVGGDSNRVYSFSLVDKDGNVLEDENGKKGSIIFADCLIPDGYAQGAELNLSSILDCMGKDCISKADFVGREDEYYDVLKEVEANVQSGAYDAKGKVGDIYGNIKDITTAVDQLWGGHGGSAPGMSGITGDEQIPESQMTEEELKAKKAEEATELIESLDAAQDTYNAKVAKAKEAYKEENGQEASGVALQNIISSAKSEIGYMYGDQFAEKIELGGK